MTPSSSAQPAPVPAGAPLTGAALLARAREAARGILRRNITPRGFVASIDGYPEVWARDSMITLLGASLANDPEVNTCFRVSLQTLVDNQDRFGQIPNFINAADGRLDWGATDANQWFVIGAARYVEVSGDRAWAAVNDLKIIAALDRLEAMDLHKTGLMVAPECGDWADLLSNRGHVLFPNVLAVHALKQGAALVKATRPAEAARLLARAEVVRAAIQHAMWVQDPQQCVDTSHRQAQRQAAVVMRRRPFFLPWINLFETDDRFDATGNLLAILCGVADADQTGKILDHIENVGLDKPFPVRVLHPPILPSDKEWREYYRVFNLNLPHQYHNGGIWAWVGGIYVAALVRAGRLARAAEVLESLAASLRPGRKAEWECNEWLHGETGRAMGAPYQAWSAGMYIYAEHAVNTGTTPGF